MWLKIDDKEMGKKIFLKKYQKEIIKYFKENGEKFV